MIPPYPDSEERPPHVIVSLSSHGFGHAAMTAPLINCLRSLVPALRITLQSSLSRDWLARRYEGEFALSPGVVDIGVCQNSATRIELEETARAYQHLHARLDDVVEAEAKRLKRSGADLVIANIPHVSLLAAARAGLPAVAVCCLNWAEIYADLCGDRPEAAAIEEQLRGAYRSADLFLRPLPAMPMADLPRLRTIGPLAHQGTARPSRLRQNFGLAPDTKIGLITLGGFPSGLSFSAWPRLPGWRWIMPDGSDGPSDGLRGDAAGMGFSDMLCSCDVVITKPGYGTFAEAAVGGIPVLAVPRADWPEAPFLLQWLMEHGRCLAVGWEQLMREECLTQCLAELLALPARAPILASGGEEGAAAILPILAATVSRRCGSFGP